MMNCKTISLWAVISMIMLTSFKQEKYRFAIVENKDAKRIDIIIDGQPFTSYIYPSSLMKPVLYPLRTSKGTLITRGWPLDPRPGERVDHPHHVGLWFNYGDVNGLDFWNNSEDIPADKRNEYGTIKHVSVNKIQSNNDQAILDVTKYWQKPDGTTLLKEDTQYKFSLEGDDRIIELKTTLTALKETVSFKDNKEGMLGIRLARELEHPSDESVKFTDANGNITAVAKLDNTKTTGKYRSSAGVEGDDVWGTRASWVNLNATLNDEPLSLVMIDHPGNTGFPTYWHARGYGLFAANPLGQHAMSNGKETLNYKLAPGKSVVFNYKVLIHSGSNLTDEEVNKSYDMFSSKSSAQAVITK